jgi:hypothetical protein
LRRPDHLTSDAQTQIERLLAGPVGDQVGVARAFLLDWYAIWWDERGQRRSHDDAGARYRRWQQDARYREVLPLARVQRQVDPTHFERLSPFLREPTWEATNNGAERTARLFRHRQAPHFTLRTEAAIDGALTVGACLHREEVTGQVRPIASRCQRGRRSRPQAEVRQLEVPQITPLRRVA